MSETKRTEPKETPKPREVERATPRQTTPAEHKVARPEQTRVGEMKAEVAKSSWEKPGTFAVTKDSQGKTQRVEGWISNTDAPRSSADKKLSREVGKEANRPTPNDGCHLIAHSLGGPRVESHGLKDARSNLVPGDKRMNTSMLAGYEQSIRQYMRDNPDKKLYMQADVKYRDGQATSVTHRVFEQDKNGKVAKHALFECNSQLEKRPSETVGTAVKRETGGKASDFYTPTRKGTAGRGS